MRIAFFLIFVWKLAAQSDMPPRVLKTVGPQFPEEARMAGTGGTVKLKVTVGLDGLPSEAVVLRSAGYGFDEAALDAVKQWRFRPATANGVAVVKAADIEMNFANSFANGRGALGPMSFVLGAGVSRPVMTAVELPVAYGAVRLDLEFSVTAEGKTENYKVTGEMPAAEEKQLLEAMRNWTFRPAMREGQAVAVRGSVSYSVK